MKKSVLLGFIIMCIGIFTGKILNNWTLTIKICGGIGLICFVISGVLSGSFVSGDRYRANSSLDTKEEKGKRNKITDFVFIVGLVNIILAVIVFLIINKS